MIQNFALWRRFDSILVFCFRCSCLTPSATLCLMWNFTVPPGGALTELPPRTFWIRWRLIDRCFAVRLPQSPPMIANLQRLTRKMKLGVHSLSGGRLPVAHSKYIPQDSCAHLPAPLGRELSNNLAFAPPVLSHVSDILSHQSDPLISSVLSDPSRLPTISTPPLFHRHPIASYSDPNFPAVNPANTLSPLPELYPVARPHVCLTPAKPRVSFSTFVPTPPTDPSCPHRSPHESSHSPSRRHGPYPPGPAKGVRPGSPTQGLPQPPQGLLLC